MNCWVIVLLTLIVIFVIYNYNINTEGFTNDEAVKNLASLYNTGNLTATNLTATTGMTTPKIQLGDKWVLSGTTDTAGINDTWLRLLGSNGAYLGGLAAGKLWVGNAYIPEVGTALNDLNTRLTTANNTISSLTARVAAIESGYVKRGSNIDLYATNDPTKCTASNNGPNKVTVSDNFFVRAYPGSALDCGAQFSIR